VYITVQAIYVLLFLEYIFYILKVIGTFGLCSKEGVESNKEHVSNIYHHVCLPIKQIHIHSFTEAPSLHLRQLSLLKETQISQIGFFHLHKNDKVVQLDRFPTIHLILQCLKVLLHSKELTSPPKRTAIYTLQNNTCRHEILLTETLPSENISDVTSQVVVR